MKHNKVTPKKLRGLKTNCNKCSLKRRKCCPYLEELTECHMFTELKEQRTVRKPEYKAVAQI